MRSGQSLYAGPSPHFYCYACGGREAVDMPIRLEDVVRRADAFRRAHRDCAPPGRTDEQVHGAARVVPIDPEALR